jgi:adenylate cyclase
MDARVVRGAARRPRLFSRLVRRERIRVTLFQGVGLAMSGLALLAFLFGLLRPLELGALDSHFSIRGTQKPPGDVVVVKIDDATFDKPSEGGLGLQWPFPRHYHAIVLDRVHRDGAKVIAFDVQFTEESTPKEDNALIDAVDRDRPVVLGTTEVDDQGHTAILGGDDFLRQLGAYPGNTNYRNDSDGAIRRLPYRIDKLKTFALVTAEVARGEPIRPADLGANPAWIDFRGPAGTIRSISYAKVERGAFPEGFFRNKVVVIGATAPSLQDVHDTAVGLVPGPEIQASAISTALRGFPLQSTSRWFDSLLIVLAGLVPATASLRLTPLRGVALSLALAAAYAVTTQIAFDHGLILPFVYPLGALLLAAAGAIAVHYVLAALERERVRMVFARFVPEAVVTEVLAATDDDLRLGGVRRTCTIMFSDVRGFTTFAETRPAEEVIGILNRYLGAMTDAILAHGGTLVSYNGDGVLAAFGVPIEQPDHADRALAAAREMLGERLSAFNSWMRSQGLTELRMGIGLNSGSVMAGNVGSAERLEYTTIGDVVNTASRIEGLTKGTPHALFLAESTVELLSKRPADLAFVDEFDIRGRKGRIRLWSLGTPAAENPAGAELVTEQA